MKVFAIAVYATRNGKPDLRASMAVNCQTKEDALKQAGIMAFRVWPTKDGWKQHTCTVASFMLTPVGKTGSSQDAPQTTMRATGAR